MSKNRTSKSTPKKESTPLRINSGMSAPEMKTSEIRDLIDFIAKSGLNEVNIETKELKLHVKREPDQKVFKTSQVSAAPAVGAFQPPAMTVAQQVTQQSAGSVAPKASSEPSGKKTVEVKSPMIGTFYRSSGPDVAPFVNVGDKITKGQTVCIIEAMKLFNEIESEFSGTVVKVMVENSTPVEYDQALFVIEPD